MIVWNSDAGPVVDEPMLLDNCPDWAAWLLAIGVGALALYAFDHPSTWFYAIAVPVSVRSNREDLDAFVRGHRALSGAIRYLLLTQPPFGDPATDAAIQRLVTARESLARD